jgi:hypothetical protein
VQQEFPEWHILAKAHWCLRDDFERDFSEYCEKHWRKFARNARGDTTEHTLEFQSLHSTYSKIFEQRLTKFIDSEGSSPTEFFKACADSLSDKYCALFEEDRFKPFVKLLLSVAQYETFYSVMVGKARVKLGLPPCRAALSGDAAW